MKCRDFDGRLCDYLDDTLSREARSEMDGHRLDCSACTTALEEADFARALLSAQPQLDPPPELIADIIHDTIGVGSGLALQPAGGPAEGGFMGWLKPIFHPLLQPRFVMGMAMTALSASMMSYYGQRTVEQWREAGTTPAAVAASVQESAGDAWAETVAAYEEAVAFYQLQTEGMDE